MLRDFALALMFLAMFCVAGGHWVVLQTVAWAEMIGTYSAQEGSLLAGVEKTFSGKAPCEKCLKIEEGRQKEEKLPASVKAEKKAENFLLARADFVIQPKCKTNIYPPMLPFQFPLRTEEPPSPVPLHA